MTSCPLVPFNYTQPPKLQLATNLIQESEASTNHHHANDTWVDLEWHGIRMEDKKKRCFQKLPTSLSDHQVVHSNRSILKRTGTSNASLQISRSRKLVNSFANRFHNPSNTMRFQIWGAGQYRRRRLAVQNCCNLRWVGAFADFKHSTAGSPDLDCNKDAEVGGLEWSAQVQTCQRNPGLTFTKSSSFRAISISSVSPRKRLKRS